MTNKISKAREALELIWRKYPLIPPDVVKAVEELRALLTTLSSIDAERLGGALECSLCRVIHGGIAPKTHAGALYEAAATLHGLVRGKDESKS